MDKNSIQQALAVPHPVAGAGLVAAGAVAKVAYCDGYASVRLNGGGLNAAQPSPSRTPRAQQCLRRETGDAARVHVEITDDAPERPMPEPKPASPVSASSGTARGRAGGARHIIAVGAGKGGVGKSSIAVNLAIGLARKGHAVGLMDGDIYGPSLPTMLGLGAIDAAVRGRMIEPFLVHNLKAMTIGALVDPDKPLVWRGPMAHGAFKQLVEQTNWGELDYLIIDLPPGTGDVALTMAQMLKLTGAVVVCTPQKVAQDDAIRAAKMFQQLGIEVLGVVENMSWFVGDDGKEYDIFGRGGAQRMAQRLGVPFLGAVPITMALRENSDNGNRRPTSPTPPTRADGSSHLRRW